MISNPLFCMNSYLRYRTIVDTRYVFSEKNETWYYQECEERIPVGCATELDAQLRKYINKTLEDGPTALMLSSGIDSAILASYLPEGTQTYTLRCLSLIHI